MVFVPGGFDLRGKSPEGGFLQNPAGLRLTKRSGLCFIGDEAEDAPILASESINGTRPVARFREDVLCDALVLPLRSGGAKGFQFPRIKGIKVTVERF